MDSLTLWVKDTLIAASDTLRLELAFSKLDSLSQRYLTRDTVNLIFTERARPEARRSRRDDDEKPEIVQFTFSDNIKSAGFDLNIPILITAPEPIASFSTENIRLYDAEDLTETPLQVRISKDTTLWRTWRIDHNWQPDAQYVLEIDSASSQNIYGITSRKFRKQFTTQKEDFYGSIILELSSVEDPLIIQLLNNSKEEKILREIRTSVNGRVAFDFLAPNKYKIKVIYDTNHNGKWDTGSFSDSQQPERVAYLPEIVKVRSNWESVFQWDMKPDPTLRKSLIDKEEEEQRLKKLQEEKMKQDQQEREPVQLDVGGRNLGMPGRR